MHLDGFALDRLALSDDVEGVSWPQVIWVEIL